MTQGKDNNLLATLMEMVNLINHSSNVTHEMMFIYALKGEY